MSKQNKKQNKGLNVHRRTLDTLHWFQTGIQFCYVKVAAISFYNGIKMLPQEKWPLKTIGWNISNIWVFSACFTFEQNRFMIYANLLFFNFLGPSAKW